jgi:hypothetical protein
MLSCRQIAAEMSGLALKTNTITFRPVAPDAMAMCHRQLYLKATVIGIVCF